MKKQPQSLIGRLAFMSSAFLALLALAFLATPLKAQIVETDQSQASTGYTISTANNLIFGATPISSTGDPTAPDGFGGNFPGGAIANLTDGTFSSSAGAAGGTGFPPGLTDITFSLGGNAAGYTLSSIDTYTGWQDSGRYQQSYTVLYSTVSSPTTFTALPTTLSGGSAGTVLYGGFGGANEAHVSLTNLSLSNVASIEFQFNGTANGWSNYSELAVFGTPTAAVPEPSTWAMLFLSAASLVFFRRKQQQTA